MNNVKFKSLSESDCLAINGGNNLDKSAWVTFLKGAIFGGVTYDVIKAGVIRIGKEVLTNNPKDDNYFMNSDYYKIFGK